MRKNIIIGILAAGILFGPRVVGLVRADSPTASRVYVQSVRVEALSAEHVEDSVQIQGREVVGFACTVGEDNLTMCWVASK
jgi:hypothetical protein